MGVWIETKVSDAIELTRLVTPCMGVWIETCTPTISHRDRQSHPVWVCGLKHIDALNRDAPRAVTPCMGVWIETMLGLIQSRP